MYDRSEIASHRRRKLGHSTRYGAIIASENAYVRNEIEGGLEEKCKSMAINITVLLSRGLLVRCWLFAAAVAYRCKFLTG